MRLSRIYGPQPFRYRVVENYPVAESAVHIYRLFRHHETRGFLDLRRIEYHAGYEAVRETGATRVIPYREAVLVIRDEHVLVFRPVVVPGDAQPVAGVQPQLPAQNLAQVHTAVTAYRDDPFPLVGQCRMGIALVINCQFHNHSHFILYIVCHYTCHAVSPAIISLLLAMNFRFARTDSIIACARRVTADVFSPICLAMVRNELPVS